jgi:hypothetical protein
VYWEQTGITQAPTFIEYTVSTTTAAISAGAVTESLVYLSVSSNTFRLIKYNPVTGAATTNISLPVNGTISGVTYYKNGYVLSIQNLGNTTAPNYRLINWTTLGTSTNFASRIISNVSWPVSTAPGGQGFSADYNTGVAVGTVAGIYGSNSNGTCVTGDFAVSQTLRRSRAR